MTGPIHTLIEHWNGGKWDIVSSPNPGTAGNLLYGVAAASPSDVWAVGYSYPSWTSGPATLIERWDGSGWVVVPSPNPVGSSYLYDVAALPSGEAWAVGEYVDVSSVRRTLIERWDGTAWTIVPSPDLGVGTSLGGVVAVSTSDVWAVGSSLDSRYRTLVEHWDGKVWSVVSSPSPEWHLGVVGGGRGRPGRRLGRGLLLEEGPDRQDVDRTLGRHGLDPRPESQHWDGSTWSPVSNHEQGALDSRLYGAAVAPSGEVWAVGFTQVEGGSIRTLAKVLCG